MEFSWLQSVLAKAPTYRHGSIYFLATLLFSVLFRRFIIDAGDPNKCQALMREGQWYYGRTWLTPGCVTDSYGWGSMNECMDQRRIVFVGDETIQGVYWAMARKLNGDITVSIEKNDLHFSNDRVTVEFVWEPFLNSTDLHARIADHHSGVKNAPAITVIGSGRWYAENNAVEDFRTVMNSVISGKKFEDYEGRIEPRQDGRSGDDGDLLLFAPVQEPYSWSGESQRYENPYRNMNAYLLNSADHGHIQFLWSWTRMTEGIKAKYMQNGRDASWEVLEKRADLLIAQRCNAKFSQTRPFPNRRTCCGGWHYPNWIQISFLVTGLGLLPAVVLLDHRSSFLGEHRSIIQAACAFMSTVSLVFVADRTHVFQQVERLPLMTKNLRNMLLISLTIGLLSVRRSQPPKKSSPVDGNADQSFLSRDQTEEWKGWMQLLIIIYHYNMAWTADWYWEIIRVTVAGYLFLTGFGHTMYFLQKEDYSCRRLVAVLLRTNLLPSTLAYVMRTRWLLYYYMPLSSFWFVVVFVTMAIGSKYNQHRYFLITKIVVSAALVQIFINTKRLPELVVDFFVLTCKMSFNAGEFFGHRVRIDQYIVYIGMLVAILYLRTKEAPLQVATSSNRFRIVAQKLRPLLGPICSVVFVVFWYFVNTQIHSQGEWTVLQPYLTVIPVLSFLGIRNAYPALRNYYSVAFAWLGRYSGEMYILQDHIWLAADQEAVLRTGLFYGNETVPDDRWRDLLLLTPLYLIACSVVGDATATITTWFTTERAASTPRAETLTNEAEMALLNGDGQNVVNGVMNEKYQGLRRPWTIIGSLIWPARARDRGILLLGWMWLLNVTYY